MSLTFKKSRLSSILGLTFEGRRVSGIVVRRNNGKCEASAPFEFLLSVDPTRDAPETVGTEIRKKLDELSIHEKGCVVGISPESFLTLTTLIPEMPEEDVSSFLELEAERSFSIGLDELSVTQSRFKGAAGGSYSTQIGVSRVLVGHLQSALVSARLNPLSFSSGIAALPPPLTGKDEGRITLFATESQITLLVSIGGGIATLRTFQLEAVEEKGIRRFATDNVGRELRITLGQLPPELSSSIKSLRLFGSPVATDALCEPLSSWCNARAIQFARVDAGSLFDGRDQFPVDAQPSPGLMLALRYLVGDPVAPEFLPPKVSQWRQLAGKYSSRKFIYAGSAAGGIGVLVVAAFLVQQLQWMSLSSEWASMQGKVRELEDLDAQVKRFRPWYDDSFRSLNMLRRLTEAFPEDSSVTAKTVEIRETGIVTCTGTARDHAALLKTLDQLRATKEVSDVQVDQVRGKSPLQFSFNFHWDGAAR
jgi:hypothetical protein